MWGWRFVIDESGFAFDTADPAEIEDSFDRFLVLLDYARSTPAEIRRSEFLFDIESSDGRRLPELLSDRGIDRDIRNALWTALDRVGKYDDEPDELAYRIDGADVAIAPSAGIAAVKARSGYDLACLTTQHAARSGECVVADIADPGRESTVYFLRSERDAPEFWRRILCRDEHSVADLEAHAELFFPRTVFADGIWAQVSRFEGARLAVWPLLVRNLGGLADHAAAVWASEVEPHRRMSQMQSRASVNCSPESPKTHANVKAMRKRTVTFDEGDVVCEWHVKLERHRNRVHFAVQSGRVYVGFFVRHMTT
ncbi:hypothetical protein [Nocardia harenae]|uniref:hypothetical protein n=1 Tax=Nocardia harenae TaxID=358707 RepID=UPI0008366BA2|nr:hypothetical protein [Nocardia harenae]